MFTVRHKESGVIYNVYNVCNDDKGYPHFLVWDKTDGNARWLWWSAKWFIPCDDCSFNFNSKI